MSAEPDNRRLLLELAGTAAGTVVFISLVGGGVISVRLYTLGLPIDSTVAVLPRETIVIAGVRVLSSGLAAALLVIAVLWAFERSGATTAQGGGLPAIVAAAVVLLLGIAPLLVFTLILGVSTGMGAVSVGAVALAAGVALLVTRRSASFGQLGVRLFVMLAVLGGVLAFARAASPPIALDFADVQLRDGARTNGFLLGQSSSVLVLAPVVLNRTIGRTVAIPRDEVIDLRLSRVERSVERIGRDPVSRFTVDVSDVAPADRARERILQKTLLRIALSAQWKYPPLIYRDSVRTWRATFAEFRERGRAIGAAQRATLEDLNEQTPIFAGKIVRITGQVLEATPWVRKVPQMVVLRQPGRQRYLATCEIWRPRRSPLRPRQHVSLRGLVLASGIFVSGSGAERSRVAMVCSSARVLS